MNRKYYFNKRLVATSLMSFCILAVIVIFISSHVGANTSASPWLSIANPTLLKEFDLGSGDSFPSTVAGLGNRDCQNETVLTRPAKLLQSPQTTTDCFVRTSFGLASSNGLLRFGNAKISGRAVNFGSYLGGLIAIPSSNDIINFTSSPSGGLFLQFSRSLPAPITVDVASSGDVSYRFNQPASAGLRDQAGNLLAAQTDSLSFSTNGKWMVVDSPFRATLRVNLDTLEVLPFRAAFNYQLGLAPALQTAISNDGRYAVVASANYSVLTLYDLSTCAPPPATINGPVNCQSRNLLPYMQGQLAGFAGTFNIRFIADEIIQLYGISTTAGVTKRSFFTLLAPGQTQIKITYLGMGDSFSSGEGDNLGGTYYEPGTDETTNLCHLSKRSYPYLIKSDLKISDFHSVACSGALEQNINSLSSGGAQYIHNDLSNFWQPGYQRQLDYLSVSKPNFLTISVGGNDVGFSDILVECATSHFKIPLPNTCGYASNQSDRANVAKLIADQYVRLKSLYQELIRSTNGKTKIYVVGYPEFVLETGGSCGVNVHLNDQEREFIAKSVHYMDQVVKSAAEAAGVQYLDVEDALTGHNLCSIVSDSQMAVNGLTEGNDNHLPWWAGYLIGGIASVIGVQRLGLGNESFHPNPIGHYLMHNKILSLTGGDLGSFVVCPATPSLFLCPRGDGSIPLPDLNYFGSGAYNYINSLNSAAAGQTSVIPEPQTLIVGDSSITSQQVHVQVSYLLPSSSVTVKFGNTSLGNFLTSAAGNIDTVVSIGSSTQPGFGSLHLFATNIAGETKDYFQDVFIPGPTGDINNNGVLDSSETCGFAVLSGVDIDQDGVDDSCDGSIGPPPPPKLTITVRSLTTK